MSFQKVGVLGSGIMGSGIAEVVASAGAAVVVRSRSQATADAMLAALEKSLAKQVEREKRTQAEADALRARVSATTRVEDLDVKRSLFNELIHVVNPEAILATNTS